MTKVDFLICGRRGFDVLKTFVETFDATAVRVVVSYADKKVLNDPYNELVHYCNGKGMTIVTKENYTADAHYYRIVIGWQFMFTADGKTIVLHDSLLPKYRGFAPLVNSLINGEKEIGVTAFIATSEYDEGPVVRQESVQANYPVTISEAMEQITPLYSVLCNFIFEQLENAGGLQAYEQDHYLATYSLWRDNDDYRIDWTHSSDRIKRKIDAVSYPYQGACSLLNGEMITIRSAEIFGDVVIENRDIGKVIFIKDGCPVVVCGDGLLKITGAYYIETNKPVIPFSKIRSRFQ